MKKSWKEKLKPNLIQWSSEYSAECKMLDFQRKNPLVYPSHHKAFNKFYKKVENFIQNTIDQSIKEKVGCEHNWIDRQCSKCGAYLLP